MFLVACASKQSGHDFIPGGTNSRYLLGDKIGS